MVRPALALDEAEQVHGQRDVPDVVDDVLEPPALDYLAFVNGADGVVGDETGLVGAVGPGLLVVHDVGDFVVVGPGAVLFYVIAAGSQRLGFVVREDGRVGVDDGVVVEFALVAYGGEDVALHEGGAVERHEGLVGVAGEDDVVEGFAGAVFVLDYDVGLVAVHLSDGAFEIYLVLKAG